MAITNLTATIASEAIFESLRDQVDPTLHGILREEIERRWPEGCKVHVHLIVSADTEKPTSELTD